MVEIFGSISYKQKIEQITCIKDTLKQSVKCNYMAGYVNGLEAALAILENRKAVLCEFEEEKPIEVTRVQGEKGRTITSGVRVLKNGC